MACGFLVLTFLAGYFKALPMKLAIATRATLVINALVNLYYAYLSVAGYSFSTLLASVFFVCSLAFLVIAALNFPYLRAFQKTRFHR